MWGPPPFPVGFAIGGGRLEPHDLRSPARPAPGDKDNSWSSHLQLARFIPAELADAFDWRDHRYRTNWGPYKICPVPCDTGDSRASRPNRTEPKLVRTLVPSIAVVAWLHFGREFQVCPVSEINKFYCLCPQHGRYQTLEDFLVFIAIQSTATPSHNGSFSGL